MSQNHVIDPTFFYDAIEEFAFDYDWYPLTGVDTDDLGRTVSTFGKSVIRGSLQSQGVTLSQNVSLNTENMEYQFFCKSLYRIGVGDFMLYKNRWLHCEGFHDYDEWGVREAALKMVNIANYHDFQEYLNYLKGQNIV
jgi:hypothetical protein